VEEQKVSEVAAVESKQPVVESKQPVVESKQPDIVVDSVVPRPGAVGDSTVARAHAEGQFPADVLVGPEGCPVWLDKETLEEQGKQMMSPAISKKDTGFVLSEYASTSFTSDTHGVTVRFLKKKNDYVKGRDSEWYGQSVVRYTVSYGNASDKNLKTDENDDRQTSNDGNPAYKCNLELVLKHWTSNELATAEKMAAEDPNLYHKTLHWTSNAAAGAVSNRDAAIDAVPDNDATNQDAVAATESVIDANATPPRYAKLWYAKLHSTEDGGHHIVAMWDVPKLIGPPSCPIVFESSASFRLVMQKSMSVATAPVAFTAAAIRKESNKQNDVHEVFQVHAPRVSHGNPFCTSYLHVEMSTRNPKHVDKAVVKEAVRKDGAMTAEKSLLEWSIPPFYDYDGHSHDYDHKYRVYWSENRQHGKEDALIQNNILNYRKFLSPEHVKHQSKWFYVERVGEGKDERREIAL